jgi:hypothetical protein
MPKNMLAGNLAVKNYFLASLKPEVDPSRRGLTNETGPRFRKSAAIFGPKWFSQRRTVS